MPSTNARPGNTTLGKIRYLINSECFQPPQANIPGYMGDVSFDMLTSWINQSYQEFIGTLVTRYEDYIINTIPVFLQTNGEAAAYLLPDDFSKVLAVDYYPTLPPNTDPGTNTAGILQNAISIQSYMNGERNQLAGAYYQGTGPWAQIARYRITGPLIEFQPRPPMAGMSFGIKYVPLPVNLHDVGTVTLTSVQPGDGVQVWVGNTLPNNGGPTKIQVDYPPSGGGPNMTSVLSWTAVTGTPTSPGEFQIGTTDIITAQNLAAAIQTTNSGVSPWTSGSIAQDRSIVKIQALGNTVQIQLLAPNSFWWQSVQNGTDPMSDDYLPANSIQLDPLPTASFSNPYGAWTNSVQAMPGMTTLTGMDELVVADCGIKTMAALERDPSIYEARKAEIKQRILTESQNRNADLPIHTTNVHRMNGNGWGGGGGY